MNLWFLILILFAHFVADFMCQSRTMANNKSTSNYWLTVHTITYGFVFGGIVGTVAAVSPEYHLTAVIHWVIVNTFCHGWQDYITSRKTSKLYSAGDYHNFFVVIGLDQFLHYATILLTGRYFFSIL